MSLPRATPVLSQDVTEVRAYITLGGELLLLLPSGGRRWRYSDPDAAERAAIDEVQALSERIGRPCVVRMEKCVLVDVVAKAVQP